MKNVAILAFLMPMILISCISFDIDDRVQEAPVLKREKKVLFEFYADKDYTIPQFDTYFVNLKVGVILLEKRNGHEEKVLEETTGWVAFKDIPQINEKIIFEKLMNVDVNKYTVVYWYTHQVRIGETIQMRSKTESLDDMELEKLVTIKF